MVKKQAKQKKSTLPKGKMGSAMILFVDLVGSAKMSDVLPTADYSRLVSQFQGLATKILSKRGISADHVDGGVRGDEVVVIAVWKEKQKEDFSQACVEFLSIAFELLQEWLFKSGTNKKRIKTSNTLPIPLGIGIHQGVVSFVERTKGQWKGSSQKVYKIEKKAVFPEGLAINFAKRVESVSRSGQSTGIAISQAFLARCRESGIPIQVGEPLEGDTKGFDHRGPIYEIETQDAVHLLLNHSKSKGGYLKKLKPTLNAVKMVFQLDPIRYLWAMENAIETLFEIGSAQTSSKLSAKTFKEAVRLGHFSMERVGPIPNLMYRVARCIYRSGDDETTTLEAMRYYNAAAQQDELLWAKIDLAAANLRLIKKNPKNSKYYGDALKAVDEVIGQAPGHFYAYNLKALILAEKAIARKVHIKSDEKKKLLTLVDTAASLNEQPMYLFDGTRARIFYAAAKKDKAKSHIEKAKEFIGESVTASGIPKKHYWQKGYAIIGFQPPRPRILKRQWDSWYQEINKL